MNMKQNKIYGFLQKWIPVLILLLYPLRKVNTGIDLMDGGYSLGNYRFFNDESGVEAGNLSGECPWSRIVQTAFWKYMDWYERVYSTSYRYYCRRRLLRIKKKAAASSPHMAW